MIQDTEHKVIPAAPVKRRRWLVNLPLHLMLLPGVIIVFIYGYFPLIGLKMAFESFIPAKGLFGPQKFVGWDNFEHLMNLPNIGSVFRNTVFIAVSKLVLMMLVPIGVSLLLNEVKNELFKRSVQTIIYLTHFMSWVLIGGILIDILSPSSGLVNYVVKAFGFEPVFFLGDKAVFPYTIIFSDIWKEFGYGTVIYLAAITGVNPEFYESAMIDGATRWQKMWYITLPGMKMVIVLLGVLSLGGILNAGFEQILVLYSPIVYETGDVIDTFVYRLGLLGGNFSLAATVGLLKSVIAFFLISVSYYTAYKTTGYRVF